jgi:hypothetical protein
LAQVGVPTQFSALLRKIERLAPSRDYLFLQFGVDSLAALGTLLQVGYIKKPIFVYSAALFNKRKHSDSR